MRALLLYYDIPQASKIANPSGQLRKCGIRVNLSCWVIPEHRMPWDYLREHLSGVSWNTVRFDESEKEKLLDMARDALRRESARVIQSMHETVDKAQASLDKWIDEGPGSDEDAHPKHTPTELYGKRVKAALSRAKREARAAEECAIAFDLLADMGEAVNAIKHAIKSQLETFLARGTQEVAHA